MTPLLCAAREGQIECVKALLDAGANAGLTSREARPFSTTYCVPCGRQVPLFFGTCWRSSLALLGELVYLLGFSP